MMIYSGNGGYVTCFCILLHFLYNAKMDDAPTYSASQFARSFAEIQLRAQKEPVAVKNHGRVTGYFVSKDEFEALQRLKALRGRARGPGDFTKAELKKLTQTEMDPRHAPLDRLLRK